MDYRVNTRILTRKDMGRLLGQHDPLVNLLADGIKYEEAFIKVSHSILVWKFRILGLVAWATQVCISDKLYHQHQYNALFIHSFKLILRRSAIYFMSIFLI